MESKKRRAPPLLLVLAVPVFVIGAVAGAYTLGHWVIVEIKPFEDR